MNQLRVKYYVMDSDSVLVIHVRYVHQTQEVFFSCTNLIDPYKSAHLSQSSQCQRYYYSEHPDSLRQ